MVTTRAICATRCVWPVYAPGSPERRQRPGHPDRRRVGDGYEVRCNAISDVNACVDVVARRHRRHRHVIRRWGMSTWPPARRSRVSSPAGQRCVLRRRDLDSGSGRTLQERASRAGGAGGRRERERIQSASRIGQQQGRGEGFRVSWHDHRSLLSCTVVNRRAKVERGPSRPAWTRTSCPSD